MNTEPEPVPPPIPVSPLAASPYPPAQRRYIPSLSSWIVGGCVLLALLGFSGPFFSQTSVRGPQTKALASAKQIALSLNLFATDHDGNFPRPGQPEMLGEVPHHSNAAFAVLFPTYCTAEKLFGNPVSAYQTRVPDEKISPGEILEPGENVYAYVMGLTDKDRPDLPLVADGTDGTGHYVCDPAKRGGVWKGKRAIVIQIDMTGQAVNLSGPDDARYVPRPDGGNLLDVSGLGRDVRLLDPAVNPR